MIAKMSVASASRFYQVLDQLFVVRESNDAWTYGNLFAMTTIAHPRAVNDLDASIGGSFGTSRDQPRPRALDFFAGSGLTTVGLSKEFDVVWANDNSVQKARVYRANHPDHLHLGTIAGVAGSELPTADLSWASFPCQDLSLAGNMEGMYTHTRSGLVWEWLRVMDEMASRPGVVVAENVIGLLSTDGGEHYQSLHNALLDRGYRVGTIVLDAVKWLPQSRPRVFVVGVQSTIDTSEFETLGAIWCHPTAVRRVASHVSSWVWWKLPEPPAREIELNSIVEFSARTDLELKAQHVLDLVPEAHRDRIEDSPEASVFPGYRRTRNGRQVLELRFDGIAGCLRTPGGGSSKQVLVIRKGKQLTTRLLTVREAARLMGAPEEYRIPGTYNDGYKAMGDAVAVPAVQYLAQYLLGPLASLVRAAII